MNTATAVSEGAELGVENGTWRGKTTIYKIDPPYVYDGKNVSFVISTTVDTDEFLMRPEFTVVREMLESIIRNEMDLGPEDPLPKSDVALFPVRDENATPFFDRDESPLGPIVSKYDATDRELFSKFGYTIQ